jgi:hypothetical protein
MLSEGASAWVQRYPSRLLRTSNNGSTERKETGAFKIYPRM